MPRAKRAAASHVVEVETRKSSRPRRSLKLEATPDTAEDDDHFDDDGDDVHAHAERRGDGAEDDDLDEGGDDFELPSSEAGPSKRTTRAKPRSSRSKPRSQPTPKSTRRAKAEPEEDSMELDAVLAASMAPPRRATRQVSYKEVPVDVDEVVDADEEDDIDAEGEAADDDDEEEEEEDGEEEDDAPRRRSQSISTPRRTRTRIPPPKEDKSDKPYKREPGTGSGRGGFSVKGAAAAAARARWDKVRREKAERGDDSDDGEKKRKTTSGRRDQRGALENVVLGQKYTVKGVEYIAGDDELIIPDDPKGEAKIDAEGRLLGGREWKLVTFNSDTRSNPERVYALTIDAARACGYTDSLAFLRRCPTIVKLACDATEREMLVNVGRITGNLKHRTVTMVAMRNVYKVMGARLIKGGKWVTDDYNEEQGLADCATYGWTPYTEVHEEEVLANAFTSLSGAGRPPANAAFLADAGVAKSSLSFYTLGGPTTHFGGSGADPFAEHNKRGKLRLLGVTEEDWMFRTAEETRRIDETLRAYREERVQELSGIDATRGWVYAVERHATGEDLAKPFPPFSLDRRRSMLSQDITFEAAQSHVQAAGGEVDQVDEVSRTPGGKIIVESVSETTGIARVGKWEPGVVRAAYEPHTHMPHVPIRTQSTTATRDRLAYQPLLGLNGSARLVYAPGIASVEYTFDPSVVDTGEDADATWFAFGDGTRGGDVVRMRTAMIAEAEEWERRARAQRALV